MQRVDFYMIPADDNKARLQFACKLTEKAVSLKNTVYIFSKGDDESAELDEMLWHFKADSFLPHGIKGGAFDDAQPVLIGNSARAGRAFDLFINLTDHMPEQVEQNQRVAEILHQEPECLTPGRERYKTYREMCQQLGADINYHDLGKA